MGFGLVLKRLRQRKGISQEILGEKAGVSFGNISDIETKDRMPTMNTVKKIAEALGTTPDAMLRAAGEIQGEEEPELTIMVSMYKDLSKQHQKAVTRLIETLLEEQEATRQGD